MKLNTLKKIILFIFTSLICATEMVSYVTYGTLIETKEQQTVFRSHDIGTKPIETSRLLLRAVKIEDAQYIFDNWARDPENVKDLTWCSHSSVEETKRIVASWVDEYDKISTYRWVITLKEKESIPIGEISVTKVFNATTCEIGYVLSKQHWNRGIMTEAATAVVAYLHNKANFKKIIGTCNFDNVASSKVLQKIGMRKVGTKKGGARKNTGEVVDLDEYLYEQP